MDHSAATPADSLVLDPTLPLFTEGSCNTPGPHSFGEKAAETLSAARRQVAYSIGADGKEIIFTSWDTESDKLAIKGALDKNKSQNTDKHVITSLMEHPSVLNTCKFPERIGYDVTYIPADGESIPGMGELERDVRDDTSVISIMHTNNETGTIQMMKEMAVIATSTIVTQLAKERTIDEALDISNQDVVGTPGGLPADRTGCAGFAHGALPGAIEDYGIEGQLKKEGLL